MDLYYYYLAITFLSVVVSLQPEIFYINFNTQVIF